MLNGTTAKWCNANNLAPMVDQASSTALRRILKRIVPQVAQSSNGMMIASTEGYWLARYACDL